MRNLFHYPCHVEVETSRHKQAAVIVAPAQSCQWFALKKDKLIQDFLPKLKNPRGVLSHKKIKIAVLNQKAWDFMLQFLL